ncbi:hypothetical protein NDR89_15725 [Cupriavidus gilardii]|uniref:Lipoprotein n=1 Tax=Cupriavidus gilardii TaxID=82541 RepID=A0ABY4VNT2_9BURK|nr:hypothetical protein [Cupriavidus gilardii]USE78894.1 hypothetical protein NDR89_19865 [Cupriavidus gilardii]USE81167.1 hypothetical protein NDR89_15725 [Cupriavidus gilardii]
MHNASRAALLAIAATLAACANTEPPKAPEVGTRQWYYRNAGEIYRRANNAYWDCVKQRSGQCQKEIDDLAQAEALKDAAQVYRVHELGGSAYRLGY